MTAPAPTTFSLSEAYRALGVRDPRAIPSITPGLLLPTISMGSVATFSGEVIEARAQAGEFLDTVAGFGVVQLQSLAKGGIVIERATASRNYVVGRNPTRPVVANLTPAESVGGLAIFSRFFTASGVPVGGINPSPVAWAQAGYESRQHWVPPGWWWTLVVANGGSPAELATVVWREIPEGQGAV